MSKRYGRNQRRAHRERILQLEADLAKHIESDTMNGELLAHLSQQLTRLRDEIAVAKQYLAPFCAALAPKILDRSSHHLKDVHYLPEFQPAPVTFQQSDTEPYARFNRIPLPVLAAKVDTDLLTQHLHAYVVFADQIVRYSATNKAVRAMPRDHLIALFSENLATQLAQQLQR